jgi:hypothetical protein
MLDPSVLAPFVTSTLVQALLSVLMSMNADAAAIRMAVASLLILFFYYKYLFLYRFDNLQIYENLRQYKSAVRRAYCPCRVLWAVG